MYVWSSESDGRVPACLSWFWDTVKEPTPWTPDWTHKKGGVQQPVSSNCPIARTVARVFKQIATSDVRENISLNILFFSDRSLRRALCVSMFFCQVQTLPCGQTGQTHMDRDGGESGQVKLRRTHKHRKRQGQCYIVLVSVGVKFQFWITELCCRLQNVSTTEIQGRPQSAGDPSSLAQGRGDPSSLAQVLRPSACPTRFVPLVPVPTRLAYWSAFGVIFGSSLPVPLFLSEWSSNGRVLLDPKLG